MLGPPAGWPQISSDVTRKRLAGLEPTERADQEIYSQDFTMRTYRELGRAAGDEARRSGGAIVDATFHHRAERAAFRGGLDDAGAPMLFVECRAPTSVLLTRARQRERNPSRISDADAAIVERQVVRRGRLRRARHTRHGCSPGGSRRVPRGDRRRPRLGQPLRRLRASIGDHPQAAWLDPRSRAKLADEVPTRGGSTDG